MKKKKLSKDSILKKTDEIVESDIDGETVMMSIENGEYYGLDSVGSHIWELIQSPIKVSELVDTLLEKYNVDHNTCESDVMEFLNELNNNKILVVEN